MNNTIKDVIKQLMVFQPAQRENVFALADKMAGLEIQERESLKNTVDLIAEFTNGTMRQKSGRPRGSKSKPKKQAAEELAEELALARGYDPNDDLLK